MHTIFYRKSARAKHLAENQTSFLMYKLDVYTLKREVNICPVCYKTKASKWFYLVSPETTDLFHACLFAKNQLCTHLSEKIKP